MFAAVKRCWPRQHHAYVTEENVVYGTPLLPTPWIGHTVSAGQAFAMSVEQESMANAQATWYGEEKYDDVIDPEAHRRRPCMVHLEYVGIQHCVEVCPRQAVPLDGGV